MIPCFLCHQPAVYRIKVSISFVEDGLPVSDGVMHQCKDCFVATEDNGTKLMKKLGATGENLRKQIKRLMGDRDASN